MTKDTVLHIRCTVKQKEKIEARAKRAGMKTSEYMLRSSLNSRTRISNTSKDMARTVTQIQVALNMTLVELEEQQENPVVKKVVKAIEGVQEEVDEAWRLL